jgi:hypothetical protein
VRKTSHEKVSGKVSRKEIAPEGSKKGKRDFFSNPKNGKNTK